MFSFSNKYCCAITLVTFKRIHKVYCDARRSGRAGVTGQAIYRERDKDNLSLRVVSFVTTQPDPQEVSFLASAIFLYHPFLSQCHLSLSLCYPSLSAAFRTLRQSHSFLS